MPSIALDAVLTLVLSACEPKLPTSTACAQLQLLTLLTPAAQLTTMVIRIR